MIQHKIALNAAETYAADSAGMLTAGMVDRGGDRLLARDGGVQDLRERARLPRGERRAADRRRHRLLEGVSVRAGGARLAHQPDLRGDERDPARAHRADGLQQPGERLKELGKAFKDPLHSIGAIGSYVAGRAKREVTKPAFTRVHPALSKEADRVATLIHTLALAVESAVLKHGKEIVDRQFLQQRIANAAIDIYMSAAVLSRTTWEIERAGGVDAVKPEMDCARLFLADRYRQVRRSIRRIARNQDDRMKAVAERVLETSEAAPLSPSDRV